VVFRDRLMHGRILRSLFCDGRVSFSWSFLTTGSSSNPPMTERCDLRTDELVHESAYRGKRTPADPRGRIDVFFHVDASKAGPGGIFSTDSSRFLYTSRGRPADIPIR